MFEYQTTGTFIRFVVVVFLLRCCCFRSLWKLVGRGFGGWAESRLHRWVGLGGLVCFCLAPSSPRGDEGPASDSDFDDLHPDTRRMVLQGLSPAGLCRISHSCCGSTSRGKVRLSHGCTGWGARRDKQTHQVNIWTQNNQKGNQMVVCFLMPPQLPQSDSACNKCTAVQLSTCDSECTIKLLALPETLSNINSRKFTNAASILGAYHFLVGVWGGAARVLVGQQPLGVSGAGRVEAGQHQHLWTDRAGWRCHRVVIMQHVEMRRVWRRGLRCGGVCATQQGGCPSIHRLVWPVETKISADHVCSDLAGLIRLKRTLGRLLH